MTKHRTKHTAAFKAKVAMAAIREDATLPELAKQFGINPSLVSKWKKIFLDNATRAFDGAAAEPTVSTERESDLLRKIGELTVERDFLAKGLARGR